MSELVFVSDLSHVDELLANSSELLDRATPATTDLTVAAELERLRIPFVDLWTFLTPEDLDRNWETAFALASSWWDEALGSSTQYRGVRLSEAGRSDWFYPFEIALNAHTSFERLFQSMSIDRVHAFFCPPTVVRRAGPSQLHRSAQSVSQAVLRWCAARTGCSVHRLRSRRPLSRQEADPCPYPSVPESWVPLKPLVPCARIVAGMPGQLFWDGTAPGIPQLRRSGRIALLLENLNYPSEIGAVEQAFQKLPGWQLVRLIAQEGGGHSWPWHSLSLRRQLKAAWQAFLRFGETYSGPHAALFQNPFLHRQFRGTWEEMFRAGQLADSFDRILDLLQPGLMLSGYANFMLEGTMLRMARARDIRTVGMIHGGLGHCHGMPTVVSVEDHMLVWGEGDLQLLGNSGTDRERFRPVGSLRYAERYLHGTVRRPSDLRQRLGLAADRPLVVFLTSAIDSGMTIVTAVPSGHRQTWREIVELARRRPDLTFLIKAHPGYDYHEFYRRLSRGGPANLVVLPAMNLTEVLQAADVAVLVNYCTTAALEAVLESVPVIFVRTAILPMPRYADSLKEHGAVSVYSVPELEAAIDRLLQDETFRRQVQADAQVMLRFNLGERTPSAQERLEQELAAITASIPARAQGGPSLEEKIHQVYTKLLGQLHDGAGQKAFFKSWAKLIRLIQGDPCALSRVRRVLFCLVMDVGQNGNAIPNRKTLLRRCFQIARKRLPLGKRDLRGMLVNLYLAALARQTTGQLVLGEATLFGRDVSFYRFVRTALQQAIAADQQLADVRRLNQDLAQRNQDLAQRNQDLAQRNLDLAGRLANRFRRVCDIVLPRGSLQRRVARKVFRVIQVARAEGLRGIVSRAMKR